MFEVQMPQFGETDESGQITRWLAQVGDTVTADDPIVEIATDKVNTEIPAQANGTITDICVAEGEEVDVGTVLAIIR